MIPSRHVHIRLATYLSSTCVKLDIPHVVYICVGVVLAVYPIEGCYECYSVVLCVYTIQYKLYVVYKLS
jgi:hypothetical protein